MKIISSEPKDYLDRSRKGLVGSLGLKTVVRSKKNQKERYAITNVSMKDTSKIIKKFNNFPYKGYARKRPKHETTESYFYLTRQLAKFMTRTDDYNLHVEHVTTEMTGT